MFNAKFVKTLVIIALIFTHAIIAMANVPPTAVNDNYYFTEDTTLIINAPGVLENDEDSDNDVLTATLVGEGTSYGTLVLNTDVHLPMSRILIFIWMIILSTLFLMRMELLLR